MAKHTLKILRCEQRKIFKVYLAIRGMALLKCNIFFAFISQFKVYCATYCAIYGAVVKQHMIATPLIISYHNNFFLNNDTPF